ncbi:hypothetical protein, partial [Nonomuraea dietziae]|uniref:hypothetical protein n=1 Tax=Nonomuraea dietziae TaxID=65515 RepID=UPI003423F50C
MNVPTKGIRPMDGVVHHALAFNTLLSSQETDAFTVTCPVALASLCPNLSSSSDLMSNRSDSLEFRPPRFRGNPSNLPALQSIREPIFRTAAPEGSVDVLRFRHQMVAPHRVGF